MSRLLSLAFLLLAESTHAQVSPEPSIPPTDDNVQAQLATLLAWGDASLRLALEGDRLQVRTDDQRSPVMSWAPSASFIAWAGTDSAQKESRVWVDAERRAIALIDDDQLQVRWLTAHDQELLESLQLPTTGYSKAALVWPKECELPVLQLIYPSGQGLIVTASMEEQLREVHRFQSVEFMTDVLSHSAEIVAGAMTLSTPAASTWVWWHDCTDNRDGSGRLDLGHPMLQPEVAAGTQSLMAFDRQANNGPLRAPLYHFATDTRILERLEPCPEGAWPVQVLGRPDDRPLRLLCWTGGNSPTASFEVSYE